jgi:hypothetical protein
MPKNDQYECSAAQSLAKEKHLNFFSSAIMQQLQEFLKEKHNKCHSMLFAKEAITFNFALHEKRKYSSKGLLFQGSFRSHAFNWCFFQSYPYKLPV